MFDLAFFAIVVVIFVLLVGVVEWIDRGRMPLHRVDRHRYWGGTSV